MEEATVREEKFHTASFTLNVYAHTSEQMMKDTAARTQSYYEKLKKA